MPELRTIVKNMVDAGEDEASIAAVIKRHKEINHPDLSPEIPPAPYTGDRVSRIAESEPDTFWGGVAKSFRSGEALKAGVEGAKGYFQGAVTDIPSSLVEFGNSLAAGLDSLATNPAEHFRVAPQAFKELGQGIVDTTKMAGSDPRAFGRLAGQLTGQPLVTEGALAGAGIAGRAARLPAAKVMEPVGRLLEGTRAIPGAPISTRGAVARLASKTVSPVGRAIRQTGENLRMAANKVETPLDLAKRIQDIPVEPTVDNPYTDIFNRQAQNQSVARDVPPIVETPNDLASRGGGTNRSNQFISEPPTDVDPIFQGPIVESAQELAARGGGTEPAFPFDPYKGTDVDPIFRNEPAPPEGNLVPGQSLSPEEQMAAAIQEVRDQFARQGEPGVQAPPDPYSLGSNAPPAQPRVSVKATPTPAPKKSAFKTKAEPQKGAFKPGNDPKPAAPKPTSDTAPPPLKSKNVKWNNPFGRFNNETGAVGRDISPIIEAQARERLARATDPNTYDLGDISQPIDLNQSIQDLFAPTSSAASTIPNTPTKTAPTGVNPLRPIVPEGQVTNRRMFELSDQIGAQNRTPAQQFAEEVLGGHEFNPDMLFTPEEQVRTPIPETSSPVENQFDPRIAPGGVVSESTPSFADIQKRMYELVDKGTNGTLTAEEFAEAQALNKQWRNHPEFDRPTEIKPEDWGDWGGDEKNLPTLINDESGSTVAKPTEPKSFLQRFKDMWEDETGAVGKNISDIQAKNKVGAGDRKWSIAHPSGKPIGDIEVTKAELAAARKAGGVPDDMDNADLSNALFQQKLEKIAEENGYSVNDLTRLRIQYHTKAAKEGSVEVKPKAPTAKSTPIGPQGKSYRVTDDNDNHLGDVTITPDEVQEAIQAAESEGVDLTPEDAHQILYEDKVEDLLAAHGRNKEDLGKTSGKIMNANQKKVRSTAESQEPTFSTNKVERPEIDPEKAWAQGGDTKPLIQEAERLAKTDGPDTKFARLLPKNLRFPLGEGETYRGRLNFLIEATKEAPISEDAAVAARLKERDDFLASIRQAAGVESLPDVKPLRNQDIGPPLRIKDLILTREGKINPRKR